MTSGPRGPGARRSRGRGVCPSRRSSGAVAGLCRHPTRCVCAAGGSRPTRKAPRGPSAASHEATGPARHPCHARSHARARDGARPRQRAVPSGGHGSCARPSGLVRASPPAAPGWEQVAGGAGPRPARARAAGARAGPARGAGGLLESPLGSRPLRRPAIVGPTAPEARDWSLLLAQPQERTAVHSPERTLRTRRSVRGPSHQVLKRTAAGSGVPLSIGLAAA